MRAEPRPRWWSHYYVHYTDAKPSRQCGDQGEPSWQMGRGPTPERDVRGHDGQARGGLRRPPPPPQPPPHPAVPRPPRPPHSLPAPAPPPARVVASGPRAPPAAPAPPPPLRRQRPPPSRTQRRQEGSSPAPRPSSVTERLGPGTEEAETRPTAVLLAAGGRGRVWRPGAASGAVAARRRRRGGMAAGRAAGGAARRRPGGTSRPGAWRWAGSPGGGGGF